VADTSRCLLLLAGLTLGAREAHAAETGWSLVGIYDSSALGTMSATARAAAGQEPAGTYVWVPAPGMTGSCGAAKAADGLGVFEAESLSSTLAPALVVLLEAAPDTAPLTRDDVRVSLGIDAPNFRLEPALSPRVLSVSIGGEGGIRYKQLVRTQLEMELCMEHKVGRGWIGGDEVGLRQAFLLDPPDTRSSEASYLGAKQDPGAPLTPDDGLPDRKYFGGERDPVPALLGPPDACLVRSPDLDASASGGSKGEGSLDLVPSDIWGASLRWCTDQERDGNLELALPRPIPFRLSDLLGAPAPNPVPTRKGLDVVVGPGDRDEDVTVSLTWGDTVLMKDEPLFSKLRTPREDAKEGEPEDGKEERGIKDLLASVPYAYPTTGTAGDPGRMTMLIIPNWQIVEGLRRLYLGNPRTALPLAGAGVQDGVGWVLNHPELLYVQVPQGGERNSETWLNLSEGLAGAPLGLRAWGYPTGLLFGRKPIAMPGRLEPGWELASEAQRASRHGVFLGALALLSALLVAGLRRLSDLWTPVPEERVAYWPGRGGQGDQAGGAPLPPPGGGKG